MGSDSLVIANTIELLGGGVASSNPACAGAVFRLQDGADPGAPQPTTDFVASLLLDGERPYGRRASNRTVKLPIWITAPDRRTLAAAQELLQRAIDQDYFTITWTRDPNSGNPGGTALPLILDCFRAEPTVPLFDTMLEKQTLGKHIEITVPALPYGRSDQQVQVPFNAPVPTSPAVAAPPAPVLLDDFSSISSVQVFRSTRCVVGPFSACWDPDRFGDYGGQFTRFTYGSPFPAPLNLEGMTGLQLWFGLGSRYYANLEFHGRTHGTSFAFTLTDGGGRVLSFARNHVFVAASQSAQDPVFSQVTVPIPQNSATFDYSNVVSYSLEVTNRVDFIRRLTWVTAYIDNLRALPGSQSVTPAVRGAVYTIYAPQGTARSPVTMSFQQAPSPGTVTTITAAGPGNYTAPAGTAYAKVQNTGGGGAGAGMTTAGVGAGGGGAEEADESVVPMAGGQVIPYVVGAGAAAGATPADGQATVFGPGPSGDLQVVANGGKSVPTNSSVAGAGGTGSANGGHHDGGAGRANPAGTFGGGGGSSGGSSSAGNTPQGSASVTFTSTTTWTCPPGVTSVLAVPTGGGGGGGSGGATGNGQGGGGGETRVATIPVTPGNVYTVTVGAAVAGVTGGVNGTDGNQSVFTGDGGVSVTAKGGTKGIGNTFDTPGNGGTGGSGGLGYAGGRGGPGYPYAGGGGSSAVNGTPGNPGGTPKGAIAPAGGGSGGDSSGAQTGNGQAGTAPGGGGGGTWNSISTSGGGARGQVVLVFPSGTGAPTNAGAVAVTGGGAGGNGGATAGSAGSNGGAPGGGGGGAFSSGTTVAGGPGGNGQIKVTPFTPAAFKHLIVHRPAAGSLKTFQPMISVGGGLDVPNGTTQYTMPQPVTGVNADFGGTYTVKAIAKSFSGTGSRTLMVTVTQYEYAGGPGYPVSTVPVSFKPSDITNGVITAGVLTLPVKAVAPDNVGGYYTVSVSDTVTADRFYDVLFLDTMGQTVEINQPSSGYITYYIDAPDPNVNVGRIMGSQGGRPNAISVMDNTPFMSGGPLHVEPNDGDNLLFCYSADAQAPNVSLAYFPCYNFDRTE